MPRLKPFQDDLPVPAVVHPAPGGPGTPSHLTIAGCLERVRLHHDLPTADHWCYRLEHGQVVHKGHGSSYLGPTIEVQKGRHVTVTWKNDIPAQSTLPYEVIKVPNPDPETTRPVPQNEPGRTGALSDAHGQDPDRARLRNLRAALVTHLHGARVQGDSDGWPDNTSISGQATRYEYPNDQAATFLWYHDHSMHVTRLNVFAGLAGAWLIRDEEEQSLNLPGGALELPLVIQDRNLDLDDQGNFTGAILHKTEVDQGPAEFFGPYTLVNGKIWPKSGVEPLLYRLRVLNGSNARTYRLIFLDDQGESINAVAVWQIGCDQGLMGNGTPAPADGLILAPAERVDLLVDFCAYKGRSITLWNTAEAPFGERTDREPDLAQVKQELEALLADPFATAASVTPDSDLFRRPFPQVMRFDVATHATGPLHQRPANPLGKPPWMPRPIPADTPVRITALVEIPTEDSHPPDATSMLVFWEFLPLDSNPPPPADPIRVTFTYFHPGKGTNVTETLWKAAEGFYDRLNWRVHLGSTELWYVVNLSNDTHPVHVHLVDFDVSQRFTFVWDQGTDTFNPLTDTLTHVDVAAPVAIEPYVLGPKDTVRVNPGEMVGVAMTFSPFPGRYVYHCHILEHEDHDMMRPFVVVPPWVPHHEH